MSGERGKQRNVDPKDLQESPHIVYWRHIDRVSKATAAGIDPGPLINLLWAMLQGLDDEIFRREWADIHEFDVGNEQTDVEVSMWELRAMEYACLIRLMRRKNMLEEAKAVGRV